MLCFLWEKKPSETTMVYGTCIFQDDEEDHFFDSREEISSFYDSCPGCPSNLDLISEETDSISWASDDPRYKVWFSNPGSIEERRARFMRWMGLDSSQSPCKESTDRDIDQITLDNGAVQMSSGSENSTFASSWANEEPCTLGDGTSEDDLEFRIKNLDDGSVFVVDRFSNDGTIRCFREDGSNWSMTADEFNRSFVRSSFVQKFMQREDNRSNNQDKMVRRGRNGWLRRLGIVACIVDREPEEIDSTLPDSNTSIPSRPQRVKVRSNGKKSKELSAVYIEQDFKAHDGAILTMKFSPDGEYLASAGEDGVVRIWKVMESERRDDGDIPENDPSCVYFKVNSHLELAPLFVNKDTTSSKSMKRTSDSACVVVPSEMFRISEKPLHEFYGHDGDVLDLSWSKDKYILSSSMDNTVRLWKVGCDNCLSVFVHNNYVSCVQFNPVNENYFVSGSIDGKVRIWEIREHQVVDWTDITHIVTALCYCLDGKRIVVGTMTGDCRFYDASDHQLQPDAQISLQSKKKSPENRITGLQYCPSNNRKLLVTSADSQIRILDGVDVISKYKGLRNAGSQIAASFTSDGNHIISASEDSNVYVWNHTDDNSPIRNHVKSSRCYERFISSHASVAIPWHRLPVLGTEQSQGIRGKCLDSLDNNNTIYLSPAGSLTLSSELFSEFLPKGTATWPEENLPSCPSVTNPTLCKSQYKFLKTSCRNSSNAWGQVIVTAGWDGRIRTFQNYGLPVNRRCS